MARKSLSLLILLAFFIIALAIPLASAANWDNWQFNQQVTFDGNSIKGNLLLEKYNPIEIKNNFGFGNTLFEGYLSKHDNVCGVDCSSTIQIKLHQDSVLIDDIKFYTLKADGSRVLQDVRSYQFYIDEVPYQIGTVMPQGLYEVRLDAEKKPSRSVDWVIETQGKTLESWAIWGGVKKVYDEIDDSSINASLWSTSITDSGTAITAIITEDTDRIILYGQMEISTAGTASETLDSNNFPSDLSFIKSITINVTEIGRASCRERV